MENVSFEGLLISGSKEMGLNNCTSLPAVESFQAAGRRLCLIDRLNIEAIEGESSGAHVLSVHVAIPSGPVVEWGLVWCNRASTSSDMMSK